MSPTAALWAVTAIAATVLVIVALCLIARAWADVRKDLP